MIRVTAEDSALRRNLRRFATFTLVGSVGTAIQYTTLGVGDTAGIASPVICSATGYTLGALANYLLNYWFAFKCQTPHAQAGAKYIAILAAGWLINLCLMSLFVVSLGWNHWLSQVFTTTLGLLWNFAGSNLWAFRSHPVESTNSMPWRSAAPPSNC